jgi:hypothetical protein
MKYILSLLTVILASPTALLSQQTWVPFTSNTPGASPIVEVLESNNLQTIIHVSIPGMWVTDTIVDGSVYQILEIPGYGTTSEIGAPQMPVIRHLLAIPAISDVRVNLMSTSVLTLNGYMVFPHQEPLQYGQVPNPFVIDTTIYYATAFYPDLIAERSEPAIWRDIRVANASLYPIRFNPINHELHIVNEFTAELQYFGSNYVNPLLNGYPSAVDPLYSSMYGNLILNYDWLGILSEQSSIIDYLIITASDYQDALQDLVFWKHKKGNVVEVAGPERIVQRPYFLVTDTTTIKQYIQQKFAHTDKLSYVLFVGDYDDIPMFQYVWSEPGYIYSDHYYSCIIGDDLYGDLAVGRFPVGSAAHVNTIVNKTFDYERTPNEDWAVDYALMVSHYFATYHYYQMQIMNEILEPNNFYTIDANGADDAWNNDRLKEYIEDTGPDYGVGIINYLGHGDWDRWNQWNIHGQSFTTTDVNGLENRHYYPIVINYCCLNGAIQRPDDEVMVEAWVRNASGGGVGALGASQEIWQSTISIFPYSIFDALINQDIYKIGWAIAYGKDCLIQTGLPSAIEDALMLNWFGDPELSVWTYTEGWFDMKLRVTHPRQISTEPTEFTVVVRDFPQAHPVKDARVCLYKDESPELFVSKFTDSNGEATFSICPTSTGTLHVTVTKHNCVPCEGVCEVIEGEASTVLKQHTANPTRFALDHNLPNPFNESIVIRYQIPTTSSGSFVSIKIYDIRGRHIRTLANSHQSGGYYSISWNGRNDSGRLMANGIYFIRFASGQYRENIKVLLMR